MAGLTMSGFSVKDVIKLLCLIVLAIPLCVLGLVAFEGSRPGSLRDFGAIPALKRGLSTAPDRPVLRSVVGMSPVRQPDNWKLSGLAAASGNLGDTGERPFVATLRMLCRNYWDEACWRFEQLEFPASQDSANTLSWDLGLSDEQLKKRQIRAAQLQLSALGFDPGPLDGVMGPQTEQALKVYLAKEAATGIGEVSEADLTKLAVTGDREFLEDSYPSSELQAAMQTFLRATEFDQDGGSEHFNRGRIYRAMGLGELAVAAQSDALARDPGDDDALIDRGHAHYQLGRYWAAFGDYRDGLGIRVFGKRYLTIKEGLTGKIDAIAPSPEPLIKRPASLQARASYRSVALPGWPKSGAAVDDETQENVPLLQDGNIHGSY